MLKKKRYLVGSRLGPRLDAGSARQFEDFVAAKEGAEVVKKTPVGRHVVQMSEDQATELKSKNPHLIVETDHELEMFRMPGLPEVLSAEAGFSRQIVVKDATDGKPIDGATLYGIGEGPAYKAETDATGTATLFSPEPFLRRLIVSARDTYWSRLSEGVSMEESEPLEVELKPLLAMGGYDWGHRLMGFPAAHRRWTGRDVRVGVVDSGVVDNLKYLHPKGGRNTLDGQDPETWYVDEKGHGTHCAGIVASVNRPIKVLGGAPDSQVFSLKVFPGGRVSDLVEAVEWCITNGMDLINLSLGSPEPSELLSAVLSDAHARGITCIAAAGNKATRVAFPAALPFVIAVSGVGRFGTFPEDSAHVLKIGRDTDWTGQLFAASFTNFGPEIDLCGPAVAILSTVPSGYAAWDGTSFSCPMVTSLAALILQAYPEIRTGDGQQPESVREILRQASISLGMPPFIQGAGMPVCSRALGLARWSQPAWN